MVEPITEDTIEEYIAECISQIWAEHNENPMTQEEKISQTFFYCGRVKSGIYSTTEMFSWLDRNGYLETETFGNYALSRTVEIITGDKVRKEIQKGVGIEKENWI